MVTTATDTSTRNYATELRVQNDSSSNATITALSQLIPRNTLGNSENSINTTEEAAKNKGGRVAVTFKQVLFNFLLLCTNMTTEGAVHERIVTICKVSRNVASGAQGLLDAVDEEDVTSAVGSVNFTSANPDTRNPRLLEAASPVFFMAYGVAVSTAFLQWTGMLGELQDCDLFATAYKVFRAQLEISTAILDPDMVQPGSLGRSLQISEARNVAHTLLIVALEETCEAGRLGKGQLDAIQAVGTRCMLAARHPAMLPSLACCTIEHMIRLNFIVLMQMLAAAFTPPDVSLEEVLSWLKQGHNVHIEAWLANLTRLQEASLDKVEGVPPLRCGIYLQHASLECGIDPQQDIIKQVCRQLGSRLMAEHTVSLQNHCQINRTTDGEVIVQQMIASCSNYLMDWPKVFGGGLQDLRSSSLSFAFLVYISLYCVYKLLLYCVQKDRDIWIILHGSPHILVHLHGREHKQK